jgi:hypothetical protein
MTPPPVLFSRDKARGTPSHKTRAHRAQVQERWRMKGYDHAKHSMHHQQHHHITGFKY